MTLGFAIGFGFGNEFNFLSEIRLFTYPLYIEISFTFPFATNMTVLISAGILRSRKLWLLIWYM
jgi:hypothetical protein